MNNTTEARVSDFLLIATALVGEIIQHMLSKPVIDITEFKQFHLLELN